MNGNIPRCIGCFSIVAILLTLLVSISDPMQVSKAEQLNCSNGATCVVNLSGGGSGVQGSQGPPGPPGPCSGLFCQGPMGVAGRTTRT
jgi:hypothetical protein